MGLRVYRDTVDGRELVGRIDFERGARSSFEYDAGYAARARNGGEFGISHQLPLSGEPYGDSEISPFFTGMLPEGEVRDRLVKMYQIPGNDYLGFLEKLGCESIGALTFASDSAAEEDFSARYDPVPRGFAERAREDPAQLAAEMARETRLSLSGAQSKVAWFLPEGADPSCSGIEEWRVPRGTAPSSHIIKIARRGEEELAMNELGCSILSASCGIDTARVDLIPDLPGAIAVERYDRKWVGREGDRRLLRLHQEDLCQALGLAPYLKYQPDGVEADYMVWIADLLRDAAANPAKDVLEFAKRTVFNYAVGNSDAHLKNSSLLYDEAWKARKLAPMYDVTCIPLSGYMTQMAFEMGSHRELEDIDERDVLAVALDADAALGAFDAAVREVVAGFEGPLVDGAADPVQDMVARIVDNSRARVEVLKRYLRG